MSVELHWMNLTVEQEVEPFLRGGVMFGAGIVGYYYLSFQS